MQPSLDDSYLRVKRARQHIKALRALQRRIAIHQDDVSIKPYPPGLKIHSNPGIHRAQRIQHAMSQVSLPPEPAADPRWAIRFGETIYNLRAALDYLVYSLAHLDSGQEQDGTQFPIFDKPSAFQNLIHPNNARNTLIGVNPTHVAMIEALQPYPGRPGLDALWLARLASFSNPDKHRKLTAVQAGTRQFVKYRIPAAPTAPVEMDFSATRYIGLGDIDKTPVVPSLDSLVAHVSETLDIFKADF